MSNNITRQTILTYQELLAVLPGTSAEPLVDVQTYDATIVAQYNKHDMYHYTGNTILVRDAVARRLAVVNQNLGDHQLKIVYGYRHPAVQEAYFYREKARVQTLYPTWSDEAVQAYTHNLVAIPSVGGHPTGGAVDLTIVDVDGNELDMGTPIADFSDPEKICTFTTAVTAEQANNRMLLHDTMIAEGFMPFYGEWWHFSYGDREWAAFYHKKMARYGAISLPS